jgi:hypothetical protein
LKRAQFGGPVQVKPTNLSTSEFIIGIDANADRLAHQNPPSQTFSLYPCDGKILAEIEE